MSFLKVLGYTRFRCRTDPERAIKAMVDAVIKCLSDDRESHARLGALEGWHNLLQGQMRALRLDVEDRFGSIVGVTRLCVPWLVTRHLAAEQISAQTEWCDRVRKFERSVIQKTINAIW